MRVVLDELLDLGHDFRFLHVLQTAQVVQLFVVLVVVVLLFILILRSLLGDSLRVFLLFVFRALSGVISLRVFLLFILRALSGAIRLRSSTSRGLATIAQGLMRTVFILGGLRLFDIDVHRNRLLDFLLLSKSRR